MKDSFKCKVGQLTFKSMKHLLFLFLIVLVVKVSYAQVEVFYEFNTNTPSGIYTGCDSCLLGSQSAVQNCECRRGCTDLIPENYQDIIDECKDDCAIEFPNDPNGYHHCLNYCDQLPFEEYNECLNGCGPPAQPVKEIVAYQYQFIASWARIPFHPWDFTGNYVVTPWSPIFASSSITIVPWTVPAPWPGVVSTSNTFYAIRLAILYSDNTECIFLGQTCQLIG